MIKPTCCLALVVLVAACSSDATKSTSGSTIASGDTTTSAGDVATTAPGAPTTVASAPATTFPEGGFGEPVPAQTYSYWWVAGAQEGDPEVTAALGVCEPFYDAIAGGPYTVQRCGVWNAIGGERMWSITKGATGRFFAIIWQLNAPNTWVPAMRALEDVAGNWADFTIRTGNIDSGSNDELVSGARWNGTGAYLELTIVDIRSGNPRVMAATDSFTKGVAVLRASNGVEYWEAIYAGGDPTCCPSTFQRFTLFATSEGDWLIVPGPTVTPDDSAIPLTEF